MHVGVLSFRLQRNKNGGLGCVRGCGSEVLGTAWWQAYLRKEAFWGEVSQVIGHDFREINALIFSLKVGPWAGMFSGSMFAVVGVEGQRFNDLGVNVLSL